MKYDAPMSRVTYYNLCKVIKEAYNNACFLSLSKAVFTLDTI